MPKKGTVTQYQVNKKYEGLGDLVQIEAPLMGLATNLDNTRREPTHAQEIFGLPDLKYGWTNIPRETTTNQLVFDFYTSNVPVDVIVGIKGSYVYLFDLKELRVIYYYIFSEVEPKTALILNDIAFACLTTGSENPLHIFFWPTNTIKQYNQNGSVLGFFKGRLFIGDGKILRFSGASITDPSFEDDPFASENGGGYLVLQHPQVSEILYLVPYEDMLYIFTDGGLFVLTVSLASNAPSTFYILDTGIRMNFKKSKPIIVFDELAVLSNLGMFWIKGLRLERFDWPIADQIGYLDFRKAGVVNYQGQKIITIPGIEGNISVGYSVEYNHFFYFPFKIINGVYNSYNTSFSFPPDDYIQILFSKEEYYPFKYTSVLHDLNQPRFKFIKDLKLNGKGHLLVDFLYDIYGLKQSEFYAQIGPDYLEFRSHIGRKGYKIGFSIYTPDNYLDFAFVSKIYMRIHLLGPINWFYYVG